MGFTLLGMSAYEGAKELVAFARAALGATSEAALDEAAEHFARAVVILGISTISAILLRKSASRVIKRPPPRVQAMPRVGSLPTPGTPPRISRPVALPSGALGETDWWGNISVIRSQSLREQRMTLLHEWVHRFFAPKVAPLRQLRAQLRASGYWRSAILRYLEEAMAESYAQLRMDGGLKGLLIGVSFPVANGYVKISQMAGEGVAIGSIALGGAQFTVRSIDKPWPVKP